MAVNQEVILFENTENNPVIENNQDGIRIKDAKNRSCVLCNVARLCWLYSQICWNITYETQVTYHLSHITYHWKLNYKRTCIMLRIKAKVQDTLPYSDLLTNSRKISETHTHSWTSLCALAHFSASSWEISA
jgi:hypothetical protein